MQYTREYTEIEREMNNQHVLIEKRINATLVISAIAQEMSKRK